VRWLHSYGPYPISSHRLPARPVARRARTLGQIGNRLKHMPDEGWSRAFDDPIPLPRGRQLVTLKDAANYIMRLPRAEHESPQWHHRGADHGGGRPWAVDACAHRCHEGIEPPPSSRPIASRQSRNASKTTLGVQANIMPKNTACKVVMGFRSLDVAFAKINALDHRRLPAQTPAPHNAALLLLHIATHKCVCLSRRAYPPAKNPPGVTGGLSRLRAQVQTLPNER
jgi:hypothetical protein